ncbi:MAG: CvpA family protein [Clostridia bacterium]|nr:CvpA family protein [Clostridia bacterium]
MNMNLIDLLLIVFLLLGIIKGYRKGLLNSLVGLCSSIIGLFVAIKTYSYVVAWLEAKYQFTSKLSQYFAERLTFSETVGESTLGSLPLSEASPAWGGLPLPEILKTQLLEISQGLGEKFGQAAVTNIGDVLYLFLAEKVLNLLAIILIWFVVNKGLCLLSNFFTSLTKDTFLGSLNRIGGICIGLLIRVLILTIIIGLCNPLFNVAPHAEPSFFSAVLITISEAQLVPCFTTLFSILTGQILTLWL